MITLTANKRDVVLTSSETLTVDSVGVLMAVACDDTWTGISCTAVFENGTIKKDVSVGIIDGAEKVIEIPWECMKQAGFLKIGLYGTNDEATIVIPTLWTKVGLVEKGTDPSGDPSVTPTPDVVQQVLNAAANAVQSATDAEKAKDDAEKALSGFTDITASAKTVPSGSSAKVTKTKTGDTYNIEFEIPAGQQGPKGDKGEQGPAGPAGANGRDGINGHDGINGRDGTDGKDGQTGPQGPQGPAGSDADVTAANIQTALGYTPANAADVTRQSAEIVGLKKLVGNDPLTEETGQRLLELEEEANKGFSSLVDLVIKLPQETAGDEICSKLTAGNKILYDILLELEEGIRHVNPV